MDDTLLALALPPLLLIPAMGLLSRIRTEHGVAAELKRKALHIGIGVAALACPRFLTSTWLIAAVLAVIVGWMIAVRHQPVLRRAFGGVLHDTERRTHGEIYYALAIAALLVAAGDDPVLYTIPVLILGLADAAAAVAGRVRPVGVLGFPATGKTVSGSAAFFAVAFVVTVWMLAALTAQPAGAVLAVSFVVAASCCAVEAVSHRGLDNVTVPATAFLVLQLTGVAS